MQLYSMLLLTFFFKKKEEVINSYKHIDRNDE